MLNFLFCNIYKIVLHFTPGLVKGKKKKKTLVKNIKDHVKIITIGCG